MPRLHPDDVARLEAELLDTRHRPGDSHEGEYRLRGADGALPLDAVSRPHRARCSGPPMRWAGSVSDIDALKHAEEALRRSEERYQLAVLGSTEGLWDWDMPSDMLFLSARAQELTLGARSASRCARAANGSTRPTTTPTTSRICARAISAHLRGRSAALQGRVPAAPPQRRMALVPPARRRGARRAGPAVPHGRFDGRHHRPQAGRGRARAARAQLRQAQKLEAIGTLAGGIAHDFNNILAAILGYGEMAQKDAREGTALRRHIDAAMSAGMRAKSLVERILAFSRSGMGERVPVHVQSVVARGARRRSRRRCRAGIVLERAARRRRRRGAGRPDAGAPGGDEPVRQRGAGDGRTARCACALDAAGPRRAAMRDQRAARRAAMCA